MAIKLRTNIRHPAQVEGGSGISVTKTNGIITVSLDEDALAGAALQSTTITAGAGLTGGGSLADNRDIAVGAGTGIQVNANDVQLAPVVDDRVLANISGGEAAPVPVTVTALLDAIFGATQGHLIKRGSSSWGALAKGSDGQFLKSNTTDLEWATATGMGDLLAGNNLVDVDDAEASIANLGFGRPATRTALKALDTTLTQIAFLTEAGRQGVFLYLLGNYAALVTADTEEGAYIAADGIATTTGAWVRWRTPRIYDVRWFGASLASSANEDAINGAIAVAKVEGAGEILVPEFYQVDAEIINDGDDISIVGINRGSGIYRTSAGRVMKFTGQRQSARDITFLSTAFTTTDTDFCVWCLDVVQFYMDRCRVVGGYNCLAITGGNCADNTFINTTFTFAIGTSQIYMSDATDGTNGAHHFYRCTINQGWPVAGHPDGTTDFKGHWTTGTPYTLGNVIFNLQGGIAFYLQCSDAGTTGASEPVVIGPYGTIIVDGGVEWTVVGRTSMTAFDISTNVYYTTVRECDMTGTYIYPVIIRNHFAGDPPNDIHFEQCTAHGPIAHGFYVNAGHQIYIRAFESWSPVDNTATTYGIWQVGGTEVKVIDCELYGFDEGINIDAGNIRVSNSSVVGNATGITVAASLTDWHLENNNTGASTMWGANTNAITIGASCDYYTIRGNRVHGAGTGLTNGSSAATNKTVDGNH